MGRLRVVVTATRVTEVNTAEYLGGIEAVIVDRKTPMHEYAEL
jgi:hypothetical protein